MGNCKKTVFSSLFVLSFLIICAQSQQRIFEWREHLAYNRAISVAIYNNKVFCATTIPSPQNYDPYFKASHQGLFSFDKNSASFETISTINSLSDIEPLLLKSNPYNKSLFIAYQNGNIDLFSNNNVINVSDIKRKQILGSKKINSVFFSGELAYVSTGFGIVVINTGNGEIKDSYIIGEGGAYLNVYECALTNDQIFAATSSGLYSAPLNNSNLSNFQSWSKVSGLPTGVYNSIVNFKGKIITNFSFFLTNNSNQVDKDTVYCFDGFKWNKYENKLSSKQPYTLSKIISNDEFNRILFLENNNIEISNDLGTDLGKLWGYKPGSGLAVSEIIFDGDYYWIADKNLGLVKCKLSTASPYAENMELIHPNSPNTYLANDIKFTHSKTLVAPVFLGDYPESSYFQEGIYVLENNYWKIVRKQTGGPYFDLASVAIDPENENHFYAAAYGVGVLEFLNDSMINLFNCINSPLPLTQGSSGSDTRVTALETDKDGNLWVAASHTNKYISVREKNGTWHALPFSNNIIKSDEIIIDQNNQVWINTLDPSIVIYKNDGSFSAPSTSNSFTITTGDGEGKINASIIYCLRDDKEGNVWVGTNKGIFVFYDAGSIVTQGKASPQQILITENDVVKILLETEDVKCIAIDGANNKWVGTQKNGIYCLSPDGQKELFHFTRENSPLFSNNIIEIAVHPETGEVFISTEKGMLSFRNSVIEGRDNFDNILVYPNPVKPNYTGPIVIKGLIDQSIVKITDVAGNLVYEVQTEGGQIIWDGKNHNGKKVVSGIYLVMCATPDGSEKAVSKIMILN